MSRATMVLTMLTMFIMMMFCMMLMTWNAVSWQLAPEGTGGAFKQRQIAIGELLQVRPSAKCS
jgi:hypothetical protein